VKDAVFQRSVIIVKHKGRSAKQKLTLIDHEIISVMLISAGLNCLPTVASKTMVDVVRMSI